MAQVETDTLLRLGWTASEEGDLELARRCYEQGAALGDPECLQSLGYMYDIGEGVTQDKARAMGLYRRAWRRGSHAAATNIAVLYREQGRPRLMFRWFERVASFGDGSAHLDMAKCYLEGVGVRRNPQSALQCLAVASTSLYISEFEREEAQALLEQLSPRMV
jgi:TPR repeat protein